MTPELTSPVEKPALDIKPLDFEGLDGIPIRPATHYPLWKRILAVTWVIGLCVIFGFLGLLVAVLATGGIGCN